MRDSLKDTETCHKEDLGWEGFCLPKGVIRWTSDRSDEELDDDDFIQLVKKFAQESNG